MSRYVGVPVCTSIFSLHFTIGLLPSLISSIKISDANNCKVVNCVIEIDSAFNELARLYTILPTLGYSNNLLETFTGVSSVVSTLISVDKKRDKPFFDTYFIIFFIVPLQEGHKLMHGTLV